ncbi:MAG: thermopsin [Thermoprotei archaeon]
MAISISAPNGTQANLSRETPTFFLTKTVFLTPYGYYSEGLQTLGKDVDLRLLVNSSEPLQVFVMNSSEFGQFSSTGHATSLFSYSGADISTQVTLGPPGKYYIVLVENNSAVPAIVTVGYATVPVSVHMIYSSPPAPIGVADYGLVNSSGILLPYRVRATEVVGQANITALKAYNPLFISPYSASMQLNAVLQENTTSGQQDYLLQNVIQFQTNQSTLRFADNVWNLTSPSSYMSSSRISGNGAVLTQAWVPPWGLASASLYSFSTGSQGYGLPLSATLEISTFVTQGKVALAFSYSLNGRKTVTYDRVLLTASKAINASIFVNGYSMTPVGNYYDAELVFGGGYDAEATDFTSMGASLSLSYVLSNGTQVRPRSLFGFGSDTAETAYGIKTVLVNGTPTVKAGKPNLAASFSKLTYRLPALATQEALIVHPTLNVLPEELLLLGIAAIFITYQETQIKAKRSDVELIG